MPHGLENESHNTEQKNLQENYVTCKIDSELFITDAERKIEPQRLTLPLHIWI